MLLRAEDIHENCWFMAIKSQDQQVLCKTTQSHFPQGHMGFVSSFGRARATVAMSK